MDQRILDLLARAGECPVLESARAASPCRQVCTTGLTVQRTLAGRDVQWVTAAGWGNPSATLYVVGNNPHSPPPSKVGTHSSEEPDWAATGADRAEHARAFALAGFPDRVRSRQERLSPTTRCQMELARLWTGGVGDPLEGVFVSELLLCPQLHDPDPTREWGAYRLCSERHLFTLLGAAQPKVVVTIGSGTTGQFLNLSQRDATNLPDDRNPVRVFPARQNGIPVVGALAPQRAQTHAGIPRREWASAVHAACQVFK
jgi:hypothetical protein